MITNDLKEVEYFERYKNARMNGTKEGWKLFPKPPNQLITRINILSIDSIDTQNMVVVLTLEIRVSWFDRRLVYNNLVEDITNFIPASAAERIWLPLDNIIFIYSVVGEMHKD